jgi:hypothetical protein
MEYHQANQYLHYESHKGMERKREESLFKERKLPKSTEESEYQDS